MNLISVDKIQKQAGDRTLFEDISFGLNEGEKIGLIGANGSGKSTLMRLLTGQDAPDNGQVLRNRELKAAFLRQRPDFEPDQGIAEHIFSQSESPVVKLIQNYEELCEKIERGGGEALQNELDLLTGEMNRLGAWQYESDVKSILHELGIRDLDQKMGELSGGKLKKVALAQTLIDDTNLLFLDEPTNHLDVDTVIWLQGYLQKTKKAIFMVTHDRYFLDDVVNVIFEISGQKIHRYNGSYSFYLERKAERELAEARSEQKAKSFLRTELEWLQRQPKARGTKQKARTDRAHAVMDRKRPEKTSEFELSVTGRRLGKRILEAKNISKSFTKQDLFKDFTYYFKYQERIGIVGPNGAGKSSFLNILTGKLKPDEGEVIPGLNTHFGYFDQTGVDLPEDERVITFIRKNAGERLELGDGRNLSAAQMLEYFNFEGRLQNSMIGKLSGGERRRLQLVYVLMKNPNFLILDEPTNDLDVSNLSILESFLESFPGCLMVVSHDRWFMDRVVDQLFVLDGRGGLESFQGNFSEYLEFQKQKAGEDKREERQAKRDKKNPDSAGSSKKKKFSNKERIEFKSLEKSIAELEKEDTLLKSQMESGESDYEQLTKWGNRHVEVEELLAKQTERWMELAESVESTE